MSAISPFGPPSLLAELPSFDLTGPLPSGLTLLEASAGTGKTYTVAALVARYLAEGVATLNQLLIVTFGRAASQELRERVRSCLFSTEAALAHPDQARGDDREFVRLLATGPDEEVAARRTRLAAALSDFDAASIATTHQFCQQVLAMLGVAGDAEPNATLVENLDDLLGQVVDDLYVRTYAAPAAELPPFDHATAIAIARSAIDDPQARLEPAGAEPDSVPAARYDFACRVRAEFGRRKSLRGVLDYDDLLSRLADSLDPGKAGSSAASARARMRARWTTVLVDEFQDTDPTQWAVLRRAFLEGGEGPADPPTMVLIGDPKQAIYGFRGGDIFTYLEATRSAAKSTLATNWRSDEALVNRLQTVLGGAELGSEDIVVRPVRASHAGWRLDGAPGSPLRLRRVPRQLVPGQSTATPSIKDVREFVCRDLTSDVVRLLGSGATFEGHPVRAGHLAVLVNTNANGLAVQQSLAEAAIPAVLGGSGSVYGSEAAADWQLFLEALEQPHRTDRVRAAALTPFLGYSAADLDRAGVDLTDRLATMFSEWAELLATRGIAAVLEILTSQYGLWARVLGWLGGERRLTDLRHIGEDLHLAARIETLGRGSLGTWLRRRREEAMAEKNEDRTRRLDSDAAAVQILTLHTSKGLEFPIVYLPFAFDRWVSDKPEFLQLHEAGSRILDVGGQNMQGASPENRSTRRDRVMGADAEQDAEALRVLYVGLTRAQSQVVAWWAPTHNTPRSGVHRVLFGQDRPLIRGEVAVPADREVTARLEEWERLGGPTIEIAGADPVDVGKVGGDGVVVERAVRTFDRTLDLEWRRSSFSSLTADAEHAGPAVASEPEQADRDDESLDPALADGPPADVAQNWPASPMAGLPAGTLFGTLVHSVLEEVDFAAADLDDQLLAACREQLAGRPADFAPPELAGALAAVIRSPLTADGVALTDFGRRDRLAELVFELPMAGGDDPVTSYRLGDLGPLLDRYLSPADPVAPYARRLTDPDLVDRPLRGYLNGSIDAVLRRTTPNGPRYTVVDYKTNWLGPAGDTQPLTAFHYRPSSVESAMVGSDYPLQALLYSVALHRFLRWRQPGYQPEVHLGGIKYLFVRGMIGPDTPIVDGTPCGVFDWRPPDELVEALSALLDGER